MPRYHLWIVKLLSTRQFFMKVHYHQVNPVTFITAKFHPRLNTCFENSMPKTTLMSTRKMEI